MTTRALRLIPAGVIALGLAPSISTAQSAARNRIDVPPVPASIEVPAGHSVFLKGHAAGTQNYICLPEGEGAAWTFLGPQATLFLPVRGDVYQQITTHFLSANPFESDLPRPTWLHSFDSSQVWGRVAAFSNDPAYVEPGAVAWLRVEVAGAMPGPASGTALAETTFIQRLNTSGGVAPAGGCTSVGAIVLVPYTTEYFFYRADRAR